jgi:hypothetical protein
MRRRYGDTGYLVDNKHYVTYNEANCGFATINGKTFDLSKHKVFERIRLIKEKHFFLGTPYHPVHQHANKQLVENFFLNAERRRRITQKEFMKFIIELNKRRYAGHY